MEKAWREGIGRRGEVKSSMEVSVVVAGEGCECVGE